MIPVIPRSIELITLATNLAVALSAWTLVASASHRALLPRRTQRTISLGAGLLLGAWLTAALLLPPAPATLDQTSSTLSPLVPLFVLGPIGLLLLVRRLSPAVRQVIASMALPGVVGVQLYRLIGAVFVILFAAGQLPAHFALPAGWGDVVVGLSAPLVALALARGVRGARALAGAWNAFGLLDLAVAVGMGTGLLVPLLLPDLGVQPAPAAAMGIYPLVLVPTFLVPVSVLLHLVVWERLRSRRLREGALVPGSAG